MVYLFYHLFVVLTSKVLEDDMFNVLRRVYAEDNNIRSTKKRWAKGLNVADVNVLVGRFSPLNIKICMKISFQVFAESKLYACWPTCCYCVS